MTLELSDLRVSYPSFTFGPVSTTFETGVTVVLGPSGSGKSSMLSLIAGFETPDGGAISLHDERIDGRPPEDRSIGVVFQNHALFPHLDVGENLAFGAAADADVEAVCEMLRITGLLDRAPGTLSGGEKQRVALARTLVSDPDALLLDEPLASLDAPIRRRLRLDLREVLSGLDIPVVYVTHDRDEAAVVGDHLAVVSDGELVQQGSVGRVLDEPATPGIAAFLGMENVFTATVVDTGGDSTTVQAGSTSFRTTSTTDSAEVSVAIRPTDLDLSEAGEPSGPNPVEATVDRVVHQHTDALVVLSSEDVGRLTARVERDRAATLASGQACVVSIPPEAVHTMSPSEPTGSTGR